jgi:hypothetical protein
LEGYTVANQKVIMSFRIDESLREAAHAMADEEKRTTSNFMEVLIQREQERRKGDEVTLDTLLMEVRRVWDFLLKQSQPKPKTRSKGPSAYDMDFEEWLDADDWKRWIDHLHKLGDHPNHYKASLHFEQLGSLYDDGYDPSEIIDDLIARGVKSVFVSGELKKANEVRKLRKAAMRNVR